MTIARTTITRMTVIRMTTAHLIASVTHWARSRGKVSSVAQVIAFRSMAVAVNIITSLLTAAVLGPSGRGEQAALILAPNFLGGLASLGLHTSMIYNLKADPADAGALLGTGLMLTFATGVLATVAGWIVLPYWLSQYDADTIMVGRLLILVTPLIVVGWSLSGAAESQGWFGLTNRTLYMQALATLVLLAILAGLHRLTPITAALSYIAPMIPAFLYVFTKIARRMRPSFRLRRDIALRLSHYGLRFCGSDLLATLASSINQIVMVAYLAPSEVGIYAVALGAAGLLGVIQTGIESVLFPAVAAQRTALVMAGVGAAFRIGTLIMVVLAGALMLVGPPLLSLAYGPKFIDAIPPFRILLLVMVVENGARTFYQLYTGGDRPGMVTVFEISAVVITIVTMLLLMPVLGILGAALALLGASAFRLLAAIVCLEPVFGIAPPRLWPNGSDIAMIWTALSHPGHPTPGAPTLATPALAAPAPGTEPPRLESAP